VQTFASSESPWPIAAGSPSVLALSWTDSRKFRFQQDSAMRLCGPKLKISPSQGLFSSLAGRRSPNSPGALEASAVGRGRALARRVALSPASQLPKRTARRPPSSPQPPPASSHKREVTTQALREWLALVSPGFRATRDPCGCGCGCGQCGVWHGVAVAVTRDDLRFAICSLLFVLSSL
jgi:hypothetical protein